MKKNDFMALKTKKIEELRKIAMDKKLEKEKLAARRGSGTEKNLKKEKNLKIEIAKILTLIHEMELGQKEEK